MFRKVLIANRGEIAVRVVRACRELGIATVVAHSTPDRDSLAVALADEAICIGPATSDKSYLNIPNVVMAALITGADALHPGYGLLSENAYLAEICEQCDITFIGPPPQIIDSFSDKVLARKLMKAAGVPIVPGSQDPLHSLDAARDAAAAIGYPVMLKALAGGGGRGMRVARDEDDLARVFPIAQMEAQSHFANGGLYVEALVEDARHIEIQLLADEHGNAVHLGERECSLQRRHQKILEESPSPVLTPDQRAELGQLAALGAIAAGYRNVGTMEFLLDKRGRFFFIEMNTRIQVEHPVTEMVTGIDIVKEQILLAAGHPLSFRQEDVQFAGAAIECRVTAEDPDRGFTPDSGTITEFLPPGGPGVRIDTHLYRGYVTPPYYDSLLCKVITWGRDRPEAIARMRRALGELRIEGVKTNIPYHLRILADERFQRGEFSTEFVSQSLAESVERHEAPDGRAVPAVPRL